MLDFSSFVRYEWKCLKFATEILESLFVNVSTIQLIEKGFSISCMNDSLFSFSLDNPFMFRKDISSCGLFIFMGYNDLNKL